MNKLIEKKTEVIKSIIFCIFFLPILDPIMLGYNSVEL